jgi:N-acetylneuraminic acid mutarotase
MRKTIYLLFILSISQLTLLAQWNPVLPFGGDARDGVASFVINGTAYVGGGIFSPDFWSFNPNTEQWTKLNDLNPNKTFAATFSLNGKGYLVGGDLAFGQATEEVWEYNPTNDTWTKKANFPGGKREGMIVLQFDNRVFLGGGTDNFTNQGYGNIYNDFYEYIPATDKWVILPSLPTKLAFASGFTIGNKGYMCLGSVGNNSISTALYQFDTTTKTWSKKTDFPGAVRDGGIAFSINGKGYAGLGQTNFSSTHSDIYEYNPSTDSWTAIPDYPNNKTGWATAFAINNKAYVGTGATVALDFSKDFYSFTATATGLEQIEKNTLNVYPNPFMNTIHLDNLPVNETVSLTDITGKVITTVNTSETNAIETKNLNAGVYFLHSNQGVTKLIKQ